MDDLIYNNIKDIPTNVLIENIKVFNHLLGKTKLNDVKEIIKMRIVNWQTELARRQPDSLYTTDINGNVELVDDIGEIA